MLQEIGTEQEQAAPTLGAGPFTVFRRITLPSIRRGLAYGVTLTTARVLGEFGAVAIVSGAIAGRTQTLTLFISDSIDNLDPQCAYAGAVILAVAALWLVLTVIGRSRNRQGRRRRGITSDRSPSDSATPSPSTTSASRSPRGHSPPCWARAVAASPPCCASSPGSSRPTPGPVEIDGQDLTAMPARDRGIGFCFQHYAPFRHLTVRRNVAFGLEVRRRPKAEIAHGSTSCSSWCASPTWPIATPRNSPAASASAWHWPGRWPSSPRSSSSTSRSAPSTPRSASSYAVAARAARQDRT